MVFIGLIALCVGAILARYFRVLILVPATIIAAVAVAVVELVGRYDLIDALLAGGKAA